jgi:hypothetical protein
MQRVRGAAPVSKKNNFAVSAQSCLGFLGKLRNPANQFI